MEKNARKRLISTNYTKPLYIALYLYGYSRDLSSMYRKNCVKKRTEIVDVCILTSHTATLKSMESKAKRLSVSVRCLHWLAIKHPKSRERSFILKHRNRFFFEGCWPPQNRKVSSSSSSCLPARPWLDMSESSISTSSWRKTNGKHLHSQQVALSNDDPCTRNRVAQWNKNSNTNKGDYSSKLSLVQRIVCNIYHIYDIYGSTP